MQGSPSAQQSLRIAPRCWRSVPDRLVELLSAAVVPYSDAGPPKSISEQRSGAYHAGALLFVLAFVKSHLRLSLSLVLSWRPEISYLGMMITVAALVAMPVLATR